MALPLHVEGNLIKDSAGNTVVLKGFNKAQFYEDPDGMALGKNRWTDANMAQELDGIRSTGANVVRGIQAIENWKYNLGPDSGKPSDYPNCDRYNRDAVITTVELYAERNMYYIFVPYKVLTWHNGENQGVTEGYMPFPPYTTCLLYTSPSPRDRS